MTTGTFYVGDVGQGCQSVEDESVDLIITSPPYFKADGYSDALMVATGMTFARVLKPGGRAYVVIAQINENLDLPMDAQRAILAGGKKNLIPGQSIIWVKSIAVGGWQEKCPECDHKWKTEVVSRGHFQPINSPNLLNYCYEFVLGFMKPPIQDAHPLNRKAPGIGVAYADKSNILRWKEATAGVHCPGDVWYVPYETTGSSIKKVHRHEFPQELARRLIVLSGIPAGSTVFDPFAGGGTSLFAARECGMNAVGNDINDNAIEMLRRSWSLGISTQTVDQTANGDTNGDGTEHP